MMGLFSSTRSPHRLQANWKFASLWQRKSLDNRSLTDGERTEALEILANSLCNRFNRGGQIDDIEESIFLLRQVILLRPMNHPNHPKSLIYLANSLFWRYRKGLSGQYDLEEAILLVRRATELLPVTHSEYPLLLFLLVSSLTERFREGGQKEDARECMPLYRKARTHPQSYRLDSAWPKALDKLSGAYLVQYSMTDDEENLDQSILVRGEVLQLLPPLHPELPEQIRMLAVTVNIRYKKGGHSSCADLDEMISCYRRYVEFQSIPPEDLHNSRNELATLLKNRFEETSDYTDIDECISLRRKLLELTPEGHPDRTKSLMSLAWALYTRFIDKTRRTHDQNNLNEAIALWRECLELTSPENQSTALINLAIELDTRFDRIGDKKDCEEAISLYTKAMALPDPLSSEWASLLKNLALTLLDHRFEKNRVKGDAEQAIWLAREALRIRNADSTYAFSEYLNQLGYSLLVQIEESNAEEGDLEECISLHRHALSLRPPEDEYHIGSLRNLAVSLHWRFKKWGQQDNLEEAISLLRQARSHTENIDNTRRLADALETRFHLNNLVYQSDFQEIASLRERADTIEREVTEDESSEDEGSDDGEFELDDDMDT